MLAILKDLRKILCTCYNRRMRPAFTRAGFLLRTSVEQATQSCAPFSGSTRWLSSTRVRLKEPDYGAAREWKAQLGTRPVADEIGEISYARSSGPGGQNVNKYIILILVDCLVLEC